MDTMQVWVQDRYGSADVLRRETQDLPSAAPGEVLLRVRSTGVNSGDVRVMMGDPLLVRAAFGLRGPRERRRGMDVAGDVVAVGRGVDHLRAGDRVAAEVSGSGFATHLALPATRAVLLPEPVMFDAAASLPVAGGTALLALDRARARVESGDRVLVLGASGGVGHFAVQLAVARGASVTAVARAESHDLVRAWGAAEVLARGADPGHGYDAVVDVSGDRPLRALQRMLAPGGRAALVAGTGGRVLGPVGRILRSALLSRRGARLVPVAATADPDRLRRLVAAVADGRLRPHVSRVFEADEAAAALAWVAAGSAVGKVVVRP